ncbi:unnamed protein product [Plasmodium vivax]|uniref:(malaria parasite P. vivax) hypothetical protein n=1 Tax=Plasmodium vivax TaxID=5855 RepID=A0A8S4HNM0_PLAVI|nr:unnamed protein product [Plasmodium vivax]
MCNFYFESELRQNLRRYFQYEFFNMHDNLDVNNPVCEELSNQGNMPKNFKNFCYILSKNIKKVCIYMNTSPKNSDYCEPLNYWVYDTLIKNKLIKDEEDISKSAIINNLTKLWNFTNCNQKCEFKKYEMSEDDFKYMKELYDYSIHYLTIDGYKDNIGVIGCKKHYCSYIKKVDKIYSTVKDLCSSSSGKPYCSLFNEIREDNIPRHYLEKYECTETDIDESLVKDEKIFSAPLLPPPEEESITHTVLETSFSPGEPFRNDSYQDAPEGSSSNSPVKVGLSLTGISFFPLLLIYKVTLNVYLHK